jgi:hypothetical protein
MFRSVHALALLFLLAAVTLETASATYGLTQVHHTHAPAPAADLDPTSAPDPRKTCYETGEKAIGAPGYPAVQYLPCCTLGDSPIETPSKDWGMFCMPPSSYPTTAPAKKCYNTGEKAIGAPGKPAIPYLSCCKQGDSPIEMPSKDWGKFCMPSGNYAVPEEKETCYKTGEKAIGAPGKPAVPYLPCCTASDEPIEMPSIDWGKFCMPKGGSTPTISAPYSTPAPGKSCYETGERVIGADYYPEVKYLNGCCNPKDVPQPGSSWGMFCLPLKTKPQNYKPELTPLPMYKPAPTPSPMYKPQPTWLPNYTSAPTAPPKNLPTYPPTPMETPGAADDDDTLSYYRY